MFRIQLITFHVIAVMWVAAHLYALLRMEMKSYDCFALDYNLKC